MNICLHNKEIYQTHEKALFMLIYYENKNISLLLSCTFFLAYAPSPCFFSQEGRPG